MVYPNRVALNINQKYVMPIPYTQQGDTARVLTFNILDKGVPFNLTGKTVRAKILKPDNTKCYNDLTITNATGGECDLKLTNQVLAVAGKVNCQLEIKEGEELLSTIIFPIDVEPSIDINGAVESTNEFTALLNGIIKLDDWDKYFKETSGKIEEKYTERLNGIDSSLGEIEQETNILETNKVDFDYLNTKLGQIVSGEPKGVYGSLESLQADKPTGGTGIYITVDNGNWNYWNGTSWVSGGVYQGQVIPQKSIEPYQTTFFKTGKNLFDKKKALIDFRVSSLNGQLESDTLFYASDYIFVEPNTQYVKSTSHTLAFYTKDYVYISGVSGELTFTTPSNCMFVRLSVQKTLYNTFQLERGSVPTSFEDYYEIIPSDKIEQSPIPMEKIPEIPIDKLDFAEALNNIFNKNDTSIILDKYMDTIGKSHDNTQYCISHFIKVYPNTQYCSFNYRFITYYDVNKNPIGEGVDNPPGLGLPFTTSSNTYYIKVSFLKANINEFHINAGEKLLPYEPFKIVIPSEYLDLSKTESEKVYIHICDIYGVPNKEILIYFNNIISNYEKGFYDIKIVCSKGMQYKDSWRYTSSQAEQFPLTIKVYKNGTILNQKNINIKIATPLELSSKKIIFIGDSTTNQLLYPQHFKTNTNAILLGTRGTTPNFHEGRSGWTAKQYCTVPSALDSQGETIVNAFWNATKNEFDFSYYMQQQSYANVDYVTIHLGINDIYQNLNVIETVGYFNRMINSIKTFNSSIKVFLVITIPPTSNADTFGVRYGCAKARWEYINDYFIMLEELRKIQNVTLVSSNAIINCDTNFVDAVHPNSDGYKQMAEQLEYAIYCN